MMNSPLSPSSSSPSSLSVFIDPSALLPGSVPLHLCRSHLVPPSHLAQQATGTCEGPVDALLATGFSGGGGGGGGVFAGSCFGGQVFAAQNDGSAFYAPPYADVTSIEGWHHSFAAAAAAAVGINGMSGGWATFDPRPIAAATAGYACGPVGYGVDVRRKNATRESTSTLKAWLFDHIKNPYPTKGEKIMLAIITKMTLTQVSTWFANARRRLKKENKMQWPPRQRPNDDEDDDEDDDDDDDRSDENSDDVTGRRAKSDVTTDAARGPSPRARSDDDDDDDVIVDTDCEGDENQFSPTNPSQNHLNGSTKASEFQGVEAPLSSSRSEPNSLSPKPDRASLAPNVPLPVQPPLSPSAGIGRQGVPLPTSLRDGGVKIKPRIWSLVDTATSGQELHRPEVVVGRSEAAFPVGRGWEGVGERAFQSWMSTVFHPPVDPLRHPSSSSSSAFPHGLYGPEICTGSDHVCALESPRHWSPSTLTFGALNGRLDLRELELGRKRHLNAAAAADQSVDV